MRKKKTSISPLKSELFAPLTQEEKSFLIETSAVLNYKKNETIIKQGSRTNNLPLFISGFGKIYLEGTNDKNLILSIVKEGGLAGLSSVYDDSANKFSLASIHSSSILEIPKSSLQEVISSNVKFAEKVIMELSDASTTCYSKMTGITNKQLHGRLADSLLYLNEEVGKRNKIDLGMSRKEIAELSGISTESAIRILSELNHDGIIALEGKTIKILQKPLLQKLSEIG